MSTGQFVCLGGCSILQQLLVFYRKTHESVSLSLQSDVIFLDFSKAFDSIPHNELLHKLRCMDMCGEL